MALQMKERILQFESKKKKRSYEVAIISFDKKVKQAQVLLKGFGIDFREKSIALKSFHIDLDIVELSKEFVEIKATLGVGLADDAGEQVWSGFVQAVVIAET